MDKPELGVKNRTGLSAKTISISETSKIVEGNIALIDKLSKEKLSRKDLVQPDKKSIKNILIQRHKQRNSLFNFLVHICYYSFFLITVCILNQSIMRAFVDRNFNLFSGHEFEILSVSVFGQIIGAIIIITKHIWNNEEDIRLSNNGRS